MRDGERVQGEGGNSQRPGNGNWKGRRGLGGGRKSSNYKQFGPGGSGGERGGGRRGSHTPRTALSQATMPLVFLPLCTPLQRSLLKGVITALDLVCTPLGGKEGVCGHGHCP